MHQDFTIAGWYAALNTLRMLRPYRLEGSKKIRIGRQYDGGYVMIDAFEDVGAAYSLGINDDVSWDLEMARRDIDIFQYDHTIESLPAQNEHFNWRKIAVSDGIVGDEGSLTLAELVQQNGHQGRRDMILKCDIEGAEWGAIRNVPSSVLGQFKQIVLEMHNFAMLADPEHTENVRATVSNLTSQHRVVHVHGNNYGGWTVVGGVPVPDVLEFTLVRKDAGVFSESNEVFPTAMDMPCTPTRSDLYLGRFAFD